MEFHAVKSQKQEAEQIATAIAAGLGPQTVAVPAAFTFLQREGTLNHTLVAAVNASAANPHAEAVLGAKWDSSFHAGWGREGEVITCLEAGRRAIRYNLDVGLHGGRETFGYAGMYLAAYALAAAHPDPVIRGAGRRLLWGDLAVFSLLDGYEMGCRGGEEGVAEEPNAVACLDLLAGRVPRINARESMTAARIFKLLLPHLGPLPKLDTVEEAVAVLRDTGVRCLLGWWWLDYGDGVWGAEIRDPGGCIKKSTGAGVIAVSRGGVARSEPVLLNRNSVRGLLLGPAGLILSGFGNPMPALPPPADEEPREPEPPEEPEAGAVPTWRVKAWLREGASDRFGEELAALLQSARRSTDPGVLASYGLLLRKVGTKP